MKQLILAVLLVVALPGCTVFSGSHPRMSEVWPTYRAPERPQLHVPDTITPGKNPELDMTVKSLYDVLSYADSLKIIVETHNAAAKAHNQAVETDLGIGQ